MNSLLISERILRGIEERRQRRKETMSPQPLAAPAPPSASPGDFSAFLAELDRSIRESIHSSLSRWEAALVPQIEDLARRLAPTPPPQAPREILPRAPKELPPPGASPAPEKPGRDTPLPGDVDSWGKLAQAVRELREEWEREITKIRFGDGSEARVEPAPDPRKSPQVAFRELERKLDELIDLLKSSKGGEGSRIPSDDVPPIIDRTTKSASP